MRIMVAGTGSGCGKTTASLLLMAALRQRGLDVAPCKVGPDYIDPGFHRLICGRPSHNLDSWLTKREDLYALLNKPADICVVEGVMGYYDGMDAVGCQQSTWEMAHWTDTPVLLVVDASGSAASAAAVVKGFMTLREDHRIAGVLINRASGQRHYELARQAIAHYTGLPCVGYLPKNVGPDLKSRHLGLVPAEEAEDVLPSVMRAAEQAAQTLDLSMILGLAGKAPERPPLPRSGKAWFAGFRMGVAMDRAFSFYYQANLDLMTEMGMTLVPFSPLTDGALPEGLDGLYIGGGFPEVFARQLSENAAMRRGVRAALEDGMPCYAECGGMMYLSERIDGQEMVGFLPQVCRMTDRLQRFGYVSVTDQTGLTFPAHEFHYAVAEETAPVHHAFEIRKASNPALCWPGGLQKKRTTAGFAHLHFLSHPELVGRLWG